MNRRIVLLLCAVLLAALGSGLVYAYVRTADERAVEAQQPVSVLVAKVPVASGTRATDAAAAGAFELKEVPAGAVAPGALSSIEPLGTSVALAPIFPGQQMLAAMFGETAATGTALALQPGQMAASFQFGDPQRVAGFVQPGSKVAVFLSGDLGSGETGVRLLEQQVTVVAAGPTTVTPPADPAQANAEALPRALLTLALDQKQTERLIFASSKGTLYLGLLNDSSAVTADAGTTNANLFAAAR